MTKPFVDWLYDEIEELSAENERLAKEVNHWREARRTALLAGDVLKAENETLRQDAERYRWLRNDALQVLVEGPIVVLADKWGGLVAQDNGSHISIDGETLDKNIDAAMKQEGER